VAKRARINSRAKGKRGERDLAAALRVLGIPARRGQQFHGGPDSADVVSELVGYHIEVKTEERLNIWKAMEQASRDSGWPEEPLVAFKKNRKEWLVALRLEDFVRLWRRANGRTEDRAL